MSNVTVQSAGTYNIENRRATFLESNEVERLYLLHLLLGRSCNFSVTGLSVNLQNTKIKNVSKSPTYWVLDTKLQVQVQVKEEGNWLFNYDKMNSSSR